MNSIDKSCNESKWLYEKCFNAWFADHFLRNSPENDPCSQQFANYQSCLAPKLKELGINSHADVNETLKQRVLEVVDKAER